MQAVHSIAGRSDLTHEICGMILNVIGCLIELNVVKSTARQKRRRRRRMLRRRRLLVESCDSSTRERTPIHPSRQQSQRRRSSSWEDKMAASNDGSLSSESKTDGVEGDDTHRMALDTLVRLAFNRFYQVW